MHLWKGLSRPLNHLAGQFLTGLKGLFRFAVGAFAVQGKNRRQNPTDHRPAGQSQGKSSHDPVVSPVDDRSLVRRGAAGSILEPTGVGDVFATSAYGGVVDSQVGYGLAGSLVENARFEDHGVNDLDQQSLAQLVQRPSGSVKEFLVDGPMAVGQLSQDPKNAGHGSRSPFEDPSQGNLLKGSCGGFGENPTKLKNNAVPCRYRKCSVHADLPINGFLNTYIGLSASFSLPLRL